MQRGRNAHSSLPPAGQAEGAAWPSPQPPAASRSLPPPPTLTALQWSGLWKGEPAREAPQEGRAYFISALSDFGSCKVVSVTYKRGLYYQGISRNSEGKYLLPTRTSDLTLLSVATHGRREAATRLSAHTFTSWLLAHHSAQAHHTSLSDTFTLESLQLCFKLA